MIHAIQFTQVYTLAKLDLSEAYLVMFYGRELSP